MLDLIKVQTCDLAGKALLWAVESVDGPMPATDGQLQLPLSDQAIDDAAGEHLIQKHGIWIDHGYSWPWLACVSGHPLDRQPGDTRAEAAARAVVHHARGETINVPKEMLL
ncbi:hypothetical protein [Pseudomonas sp. C5pp]|uniref:hypothetical protein n=1 Tax=Pseudomonas sp. C5pp TaxID=1586081 RepID=UPI00057EC623|nr:hypothetical protein [Pseudomonas sp. C5pp]KIC79459.1 hypothetical protein RR51_26745 [Pseudomonas sp. C5pp]